MYHIIEGDSEGRLEIKTDPKTNAGYVTIKKVMLPFTGICIFHRLPINMLGPINRVIILM